MEVKFKPMSNSKAKAFPMISFLPPFLERADSSNLKTFLSPDVSQLFYVSQKRPTELQEKLRGQSPHLTKLSPYPLVPRPHILPYFVEVFKEI